MSKERLPCLLIVWWSVTGASRQLAEAALDGGQHEPRARTRSLRCDQAVADDLLAADGYLFIAPENLASLAGVMKDFFDRSYYAALDRLVGRPYASIVAAGSDGAGASRQIARIATGWRLRAVAQPMIVLTGAQTPQRILAPKTVDPASLARARELGETLASGLALGLW